MWEKPGGAHKRRRGAAFGGQESRDGWSSAAAEEKFL